ncbi:MAG TPA: hypothetical protein VF486_17315 [Actinomycetes bacterium]
MSRRILVLAVLAAALLTVQTTAWAKGASKGTVSGGGLASPISVTGEGEPGSGDLLARLAEQTGAYVAMYGEDAGSGTLVAAKPTGSLGPHFLVTYSVPSPAGGEDAVRQDLYPFAAHGPVSFTAGGQRFMDGMQTGEGWFQAPVALRETLAAIGVRKASNAAAAQPAEAKAVTPAAASQPARSGSAAPLLTAGAVVALLLAGGLTTVALRRRSSSS